MLFLMPEGDPVGIELVELIGGLLRVPPRSDFFLQAITGGEDEKITIP
jgi:hypothetical protein